MDVIEIDLSLRSREYFLSEFNGIMTSPYNGRHYVFMLILEFFLFEWNFFYIWMSYHEYITNPCVSASLSPDKLNFSSKSYQVIFDIYTYLN